MLKSPPAHQQQTNTTQQRLLVPLPSNAGSEKVTTSSSSSTGDIKNSLANGLGDSAYSADDEELPGDDYRRDYDDVLDLSCKVRSKDEENGHANPVGGGRSTCGTGVKRIHESDNEDEKELKKKRVEGVKRKHLRKKRRDIGGGVSGGRATVISFAGAGSHGDDGSSSSEEDEEARKISRRRRKRFVRDCDVGGFDVDEHFTRSLGVGWERVVGGIGGVSGLQALVGSGSVGGSDCKDNVMPDGLSNSGSSRVIIEDSIKPSDVDDHFAKALGSETWSKIIANTRASSSAAPSPPSGVSTTPPPAIIPPTITTPVQVINTDTTLPIIAQKQGPLLIPSAPISTQSNSNSFKIDAIIGNTVKDQ